MKRKILFLAEGILLLVLLLLCFSRSGEVAEINSRELQRDEETGELVSSTFPLSPGVYRIIVEADAAPRSGLAFSRSWMPFPAT